MSDKEVWDSIIKKLKYEEEPEENKILNLFTKYNSLYLEDNDLNKPHPSLFISACLKIASLLSDPAKFDVQAEHDIVYLISVSEIKNITEDDVIFLSKCGVLYDEETDSLAMNT